MAQQTSGDLRAEKEGAIRRFKHLESLVWADLAVFAVFFLAVLVILRVIQVGEVPSVEPVLNWVLVGLFLAYIAYSYWRYRHISERIRLAPDVAYCASMDAASELDKGNLIGASILVGELLKAEPFLVRRRPVNLRSWKQTPELGAILYLRPRRYRKAISAAIQASGEKAGEFSCHLRELADIFSVEMDEKQYVAMQKSMQWLVDESKEYGQPGLREKYGDLGFVAQLTGWILIPIIAVLIGRFA